MKNRGVLLILLGLVAAGIALWIVVSTAGYWPFPYGDLSAVTWCTIAAPDNAELEGGAEYNHPLVKTEKDEVPSFRIDAKKTFRIELGQGSGWHGLNTTRISEDSVVTLYRMQTEAAWLGPRHYWVTATLQLTPSSLDEVCTAIEANGLLEMDKAYHAAAGDGTQWVLWIQQDHKAKSVYFNNHFPDQIIRFAGRLDAILHENGLESAVWSRVPLSADRKHEKALWESISR
jgi:hypothetical protein